MLFDILSEGDFYGASICMLDIWSRKWLGRWNGGDNGSIMTWIFKWIIPVFVCEDYFTQRLDFLRFICENREKISRLELKELLPSSGKAGNRVFHTTQLWMDDGILAVICPNPSCHEHVVIIFSVSKCSDALHVTTYTLWACVFFHVLFLTLSFQVF